MNRLITSIVIETVISKLPANKSPGSDDFMGEFCQTFYLSEAVPKTCRVGKTPKLIP